MKVSINPSSHVRLTYDGPALEAHSMDVRLLSPALLAFGDLCEDAGKSLFGASVTTRVEVKASFRTGSFGIDLNVVQGLMHQLTTLLTGADVSAIANAKTLLEILGIGGGSVLTVTKGLIGTLRWLKNRTIKRIETTEDGRRIVTVDGDNIVVEEQVILLLRSRAVRMTCSPSAVPR